MLSAVGVHVFAGGFTRGVQDAGWRVPLHLETLGFGQDTARRMCGVEVVNDESATWPELSGDDYVMAFGNPRCTAFSTITSGPKYEASNAHGAWAKQTCDIHQLCEYSAGRFDFVVFESVQEAKKASGGDLMDYLVREIFAPRHYRVAHLFINAATFGCPQQRKRYFFVAYRDCYKFCIQPPQVSPWYPVLYDAIYDRTSRPAREADLNADDAEYDEDCHGRLTTHEWEVLPRMPCGWSLHTMARYAYSELTPYHQRKWDLRESSLPFSLHGISRLNWLRPSPTLHSSCVRFIHPTCHRPLTVGEIAAIMGWPTIPVGPKPAAQIAKGIVPAVGAWLAQQVELSLAGHWGSDDWESSYDDHEGEWVGGDATGKTEKTFDMTRYGGTLFDIERYPAEVRDAHLIWREMNERLRKRGRDVASDAGAAAGLAD